MSASVTGRRESGWDALRSQLRERPSLVLVGVLLFLVLELIE